MIFIHEKINSTIPAVCAALDQGDKAFFESLIDAAAASGAQYMDINTSMSQEEEANLLMLARLVGERSSMGVCIDTPDKALMKRVLPQVENPHILLNSLSLEGYDASLAALAGELGCGVIALPIGEGKMPSTVDELMANAHALILRLAQDGIKEENIYIDLLVSALATNSQSAKQSVEFLRLLKEVHPTVKTTCGLSNVSFSLPERSRINGAFLSLLQTNGLDSAILDSTDQNILFASRISSMLSGEDHFCMNYIKHCRKAKQKA